MVMGVFAPWSSAGDPAARYPEEAWNQADPGGAYHCVKPPSARPVQAMRDAREALGKTDRC